MEASFARPRQRFRVTKVVVAAFRLEHSHGRRHHTRLDVNAYAKKIMLGGRGPSSSLVLAATRRPR